MLDNFSGRYDDLTVSQIQELTNRRFGVGGDGLIRINKHESLDFYVDYFNADGSQSFCGNGARCSIQFFSDVIRSGKSFRFDAIDGLHSGSIIEKGIVELGMRNVQSIEQIDEHNFFLDTGSPHWISFNDESPIDHMDLLDFAKGIRFNDRFKKEGVNVNVVEILSPGKIKIRTYERGVEDETLACGTGVTAAALAYNHAKDVDCKSVSVLAKGGALNVQFKSTSNGYEDILLEGPAQFVFKGELTIE